MRKIPKRAPASDVRAAGAPARIVERPPARRGRRRPRRTIAPASDAERLDMAFLAALMYLPDQPARAAASDALVRRADLHKAARAIVEAGLRLKWEDWWSLGVLADHAGIDLRRALRKRG